MEPFALAMTLLIIAELRLGRADKNGAILFALMALAALIISALS